MDHAERHRLASRIRAGLQRHLGAGIDVDAMLSQPEYAREVMLVCQGLNDVELKDLAGQFEQASAGQPKPMPRVSGNAVPELTQQALPRAPRAPGSPPESASAPQDAAWAHDTSGFGVTRSAPWSEEEWSPRSRLRLGHWFRRDSRR